MQTSDSIVIIPTYNERENIENIIRAVFALEKSLKMARLTALPASSKRCSKSFPNAYS